MLWIERRIVRMLKTDLMSVSGFSNCVSFIVSCGLLAMAQPLLREGKTTRSLQITVLQQNGNRPCQAISASVFSCTPPTTYSTNHSLPFPRVHHVRRLPLDEAPLCVCVCVGGMHVTLIWQVSINTFLLLCCLHL